MDASVFVAELLAALATIESVEQVTLRTEGPVVNGRATLSAELFLAFYYNQSTGTQAFALIKDTGRRWGIDYDNIRGWHFHPIEAPDRHIATEPQSIAAIIQQLKEVLTKIR